MVSLDYFNFCPQVSERQSDGEMEGIVTTEPRVDDGVVLLVVFLVGRVDGFHTEVESQDEVAEVETEACTITDGQLAGEVLQAKLSARLNVEVA